ncbi:uncharacterized protein Z519_05326 [Cladophialophora bantiana CBS 173.52]|uniref:DUF6594 domain-containing protein n=1 Tax=Cladophialophora bantiana (strain ATCC 10958 / CBS 173.52 / CDC B-1940 / NIH 8579) TaxID=1442370 RepID=A0A0D2HT55_CLAB1|nr:uncharacterized protein Z519_05326 [Cladophialophora bantiana CBS 173.52]KIW94010.1 hypothetical protein Z519_05326 [Cladophialophora bantiana CBS 173.52]
MGSYDELSALIGKCPELAIVRRFGQLAAQVTLRMQAELLELEHDLRVLGKFEVQHPDLRGHAKSWEKLNEAIDAGGRSVRKEKILEAEEKLGRYYEFISRTAAVIKLGSPDSCDIDFLRAWLRDEKCGNNFLKLSAGAEAMAWDVNHTGDLITLNKRTDRFAAWVANALIPFYRKRVGHRLQRRTDEEALGSYYAYDDKKLAILGNVLCTVLSTMVPSSSILVLYYVKSMLSRLLLIIGFSSLFSLIMGLVAHGRRYEIFAATIAFAAVQVVFVGGVTAGPRSSN